MKPSMFEKHYAVHKENVTKGPGLPGGFKSQNASADGIRDAFEIVYAIGGHELFREMMNTLVIGIGRDIDEVESELGTFGDDIAASLCQSLADGWNLYEENGKYPAWLRWVVDGVLKTKGITEM
jgi:hypothetical protein